MPSPYDEPIHVVDKRSKPFIIFDRLVYDRHLKDIGPVGFAVYVVMHTESMDAAARGQTLKLVKTAAIAEKLGIPENDVYEAIMLLQRLSLVSVGPKEG